MTAQHHRIRRQVLEVEIQDPAAAWSLQGELTRIHHRHLAALVESCCTEAGDPDRLHRIAALEVDLGRLDPEHLERDLVDRLGPRLRQALAERIREDDEALARTGRDPETESRLELVASFARHGHLPWWADASQPCVLDDALELLLRRAAPALVAVVRGLAREGDPLRRIVRFGADAQLATLFDALAAQAGLELSGGAAVLQSLSRAHRTVPDATPSRLRKAVWVGALQAASDCAGAGDAAGFWREALGRIAREAGVTYEELVRRIDTERESLSGGGVRDEVTRSLARAPREAPAIRTTSREEASDGATAQAPGLIDEPSAAQIATELDAVLGRLSRTLSPDLITRLRMTARDVPAARQTALLAVLRALDRPAPAPGTSRPPAGARTLHVLLESVIASMPRDATTTRHAGTPEALQDFGRRTSPPDAAAEEIASLLQTLVELIGPDATLDGERPWPPLEDLLTQLRAVEHAPTAAGRAALQAALEELGRRSPASGTSIPEVAASLLRSLLELLAPGAPANPDGPSSSATAGDVHRWLREPAAPSAGETLTGSGTGETSAAPDTSEPLPERRAMAPAASARDLAAPDDTSPRAVLDLRAARSAEARLRDRTTALQAPRDLPGPPRGSSPEAVAERDRLLQVVLSVPVAVHSVPVAAPSVPVAAPSVSVAAPSVPGAVPSAPEAAPSALASLPAGARALLRLDPALSDEAYVENAGMVVLWPFLERLFEQLLLMIEGRFQDDAARERAAGLLQHLVTGDRAPAEYDLPLAKVLCGIDPTAVVDLDLPVTDAEAEECTNLLTAAIANAPILGEMSIDGFRGSFLIRKGVLQTRDGAWLLRVERASYDVVLDRLPWGMSWVKLPWMDTPLCVEW